MQQILHPHFKCPALMRDEDTRKAYVDETLCAGCGVCVDICPQGSISKEAIS